jgi:hypothetical protein
VAGHRDAITCFALSAGADRVPAEIAAWRLASHYTDPAGRGGRVRVLLVVSAGDL